MSTNDKELNKSAEAQRLNDLLEYQSKSIVSRVLMKTKAGTVNLFAFSKGEGLSEHTAPFDALVHVIEGDAKVCIAYDQFDVRQGEIIKLPANIPHAVSASSDFKMVLTMIRDLE